MKYELTLDCEGMVKPSAVYPYELTLDGIVVGKGTLGFRGNGVESVSSQPSTEDAGENVVTVRTDDGQEFAFVVRNGSRGNGIEDITFKGYDEDGSAIYTITDTDGNAYDFTTPKGLTGNGIERIDVTESTADAGSNLIDVVFTDGTSKSFSVRNGSKGTAAGFGEVTASIDGNVGTPSVSVETGGTDEEKTFSFKFSNIRGNGISSMKVTPSTEDAGRNAIEFSFLDGSKKSFDIYNGSRGNGISSIDVLPSSTDSGENKVTVNFTDGWSKTFSVYNGGTGRAAGFGKPTVSIEGGYGTPSATVEASGPDTAKVFSFKLSNLKGNGIESADYIQSTQDDGSNRLTLTFSDGTTKDVAIKNGSKGSKGDTGAPFSISKVYGSIAAMNAGHATDGVPIGGFVVIDTGDVEDPDNAKLFVKNSTEYGYLTDMSGSKGIQGPKGVGVSSVEQTVTSTEDGGENSIVVKLDNGEEFPFAVRNGRKGSTGSAAGFGTPTATVDGNEGTPYVTVSATGPDTAKVFSFAFRNLKGHTPTQAEMDALVDANGTVVDTKDGLAEHIASKDNPHDVTKDQVGLGNVDNTSDMAKPVSTAMQEALDDKIGKEGIKAVVSDIIADSYGLTVLDGKLCAVYTEE